MREDTYEYRTETDGKYANRFTALSIHFQRLGNYRSTWNLIDKVVFEALLVNSRSYGNEDFFFQQERWEKQVGVTWHMIKQSMEKFQEMGFIDIERREPKKMNYYTVNYDEIINNLYKIYNFSEVEHTGIKDRLKIFFEWWRDHDFDDYTIPSLKDGKLVVEWDSSILEAEEDSKETEEAILSDTYQNIDHDE